MKKEVIELPLKKGEPTVLFWTVSTCSELKASSIRNKTVESMEDKDIRGVAYRYLQNKSIKSSEINAVIATLSFVIVTVSITFGALYYMNTFINRDEEQDKRGLQALDVMCQLLLALFNAKNYFVLHSTLADFGNLMKYGETEEGCIAWLSTHLKPQEIKKLQTMTFDKNSFFAVNKLLENSSEASSKNIPSKFKKDDSGCVLF